MDPHYVIPAILGLLVTALIVAVAISLGGGESTAPVATNSLKPGLGPWYIVRKGDNYTRIARRTGLTIDQLETFNPYTNPATITPGQRLKLVLHPPLPKPRPRGPEFHTVRTGETFASIAAETRHSVTNLVRLNPKLNPATLQPGARMRLRE